MQDAFYNLNTAGTAQQNADYGTTSCSFSSTNYWLDTWNSKSTTVEKRLNLNIEPTIPTEGDNAQSVSNNAILRARLTTTRIATQATMGFAQLPIKLRTTIRKSL